MPPDDLRCWYEDYLEACNRHDLDAIRERLHPEVRRSGHARGADAWVDDIHDLLDGFPDYRWKRITLLVDGDRIAVHLRASGTHRGSFQGIAPTGRHVNVAEFAFYRLAGGRIIEYAGTADGADLRHQLID